MPGDKRLYQAPRDGSGANKQIGNQFVTPGSVDQNAQYVYPESNVNYVADKAALQQQMNAYQVDPYSQPQNKPDYGYTPVAAPQRYPIVPVVSNMTPQFQQPVKYATLQPRTYSPQHKQQAFSYQPPTQQVTSNPVVPQRRSIVTKPVSTSFFQATPKSQMYAFDDEEDFINRTAPRRKTTSPFAVQEPIVDDEYKQMQDVQVKMEQDYQRKLKDVNDEAVQRMHYLEKERQKMVQQVKDETEYRIKSQEQRRQELTKQMNIVNDEAFDQMKIVEAEKQEQLKRVKGAATEKIKAYEAERQELMEEVQVVNDEAADKLRDLEAQKQELMKKVNDEANEKMKAYERERQKFLDKADYLEKSSRVNKEKTPKSWPEDLMLQSEFTAYSPDPTVGLSPLEDLENETFKIKRFYDEYCQAIKKNLSYGMQINIVDVLVTLHFMDERAVNDTRDSLNKMLVKHQKNLMIQSQQGEYNGEREDMVKNLFKVLCGIQNYQLNQKWYTPLKEEQFREITNIIQFGHKDPNWIIMDQIFTIRNIVRHQALQLTPKQIELCHKKFKNFYKQRKQWEQTNEWPVTIPQNMDGTLASPGRPINEQPICVLSVERDDGILDKILVYEGDEPQDIVEDYTRKHKMTESAKRRLFKEIYAEVSKFNSQKQGFNDSEIIWGDDY